MCRVDLGNDAPHCIAGDARLLEEAVRLVINLEPVCPYLEFDLFNVVLCSGNRKPLFFLKMSV